MPSWLMTRPRSIDSKPLSTDACHSPSASESCVSGTTHSATDGSSDGWNVRSANGCGGAVISTRRDSSGFLSTYRTIAVLTAVVYSVCTSPSMSSTIALT